MTASDPPDLHSKPCWCVHADTFDTAVHAQLGLKAACREFGTVGAQVPGSMIP